MNEHIDNELIFGKVETLAFGGQGIIRQNGLVTFVPYTAVGDDISYSVTKIKKNFSEGVLNEVLQKGSGRTIPLCPYFGTCGGCQLQHVTYPTQINYKQKWVEDAVRRQAGLSYPIIPEVVPSENAWYYRRRISLTLRARQQAYQLGYIGIDQKSLIEIDQCPIFVEQSDSIITFVSDLANKLWNHGRMDAKVTILKEMNDCYILHFHFKILPKNAKEVLKNIVQDHPFIKGILVTANQNTLQYGDIESFFDINALRFRYSPRAFVQNHSSQSKNIYLSVQNHVQNYLQNHVKNPEKKESAIDLYCGIGVISLLLSQLGLKTSGIESNGAAVQLAKSNARDNRMDHVRFFKEDVENVLESYLQKETPAVIVINPPREGISTKVLEILKKYPPKMLIYISCMPATLGRDLKLLCDKIYHVDNIEIYDMFPQTTHVESLVVLKAG